MADDFPLVAQMRQRAVVVTGAIADAVARAVERRQRHQQDVGSNFERGRRRLENAERAAQQLVVGGPGAKLQRLVARRYHRQRQPRALRGELSHQGKRIDLAADRRIAGDHGAGRDIDRQSAPGDELRKGSAAFVIEASRAASAAARRFCFRLGLPAATDMRRYYPLSHPAKQEKCEAAMAVGALDPGVPYESRWAPCARSTDLARDSSRKDR